MRWCVVIRALKTTTQLALPALSISVSAIWGTFTVDSWVAWIRSEKHREEKEHGQVVDISRGETQYSYTLCKQPLVNNCSDDGKGRQVGFKWQIDG